MTRRTIALTATFAVTFACFTADTFAGCSKSRCKSSRRYSYVRPVVKVVHHAPPVVHAAPPVVVAAPKIRPNYPTVPAGSTITLPANFLGQQPGSVLMVFNNIKLPVQVNNWSQTGVTVTLPPMAIKDAVVIRLDILLPHGQLGHTQKLLVTAPAPVVLHPTAPTSPLPTNAALQVQAN